MSSEILIGGEAFFERITCTRTWRHLYFCAFGTMRVDASSLSFFTTFIVIADLIPFSL